MKESQHSGPYKDLGFLPDVRVTMLHYSHSCLHEMEENLIPLIFKRIEEEKAKLSAHLSLQQVSASARLQLSGSFQPQEFGYEATPPIFHIQGSQGSFTPHPGCSYPIPRGIHRSSPKTVIITQN